MRLLGLIDFSVLSYRYKIYKNIDRNGYKEVIKMDNEKEQIINYWVNKDKTSTQMEPEKLLKHIENFVANRKILQQIPTIPAIFPYAFLTLLSFIFSLSLINSDINKFVIKNSIYSANGSPKDPQCVFSLCL